MSGDESRSGLRVVFTHEAAAYMSSVSSAQPDALTNRSLLRRFRLHVPPDQLAQYL